MSTTLHVPSCAEEEGLFIWKFLIGAKPVEDPDDANLTYSYCIAVAVAPSMNAARERLREYAQLNGAPANWLKVAQIVQMRLVDKSVIAWLT